MGEEYNKAVTLVCRYVPEDEEVSHELALHLAGLRRAGFIETIHEYEINRDDLERNAIDPRIFEANIILLSTSPDFLSSKYCFSKEMSIILERHQKGQACVIPVLLQPSEWKRSPIGMLEAFPTREREVSRWSLQDEALVNVVEGVRDAIQCYWTCQKISHLTFEVQQLLNKMNKIAHETQQISREIEQIKPGLTTNQDPSIYSPVENVAESPSPIGYTFTQEGRFKEYREALSKLQNAVTSSVYQCQQIEELHAS
jgi:hypothetical protein